MSEGLDDWGGTEFILAADRLDTPDVIQAADPGDMLRQVASSAAQVRTALRSCQETDLSAFTPDTRPRAIVAAGLGSSGGVAAEMLHALVGRSSPVQVVPLRAGRLPGWVGAADVVLAVSSSGTTAETLAIAAEAARRGCRLEDVSHQCRPASESFVNPGKSLALDLAGALPVIWGTTELGGVAARRFAGQLSENAKYPAIAGVLPEAAFDQLAAFDGPFAPAARPPAAGRERPREVPGGHPDLEDLAWDLDYDETEAEASGFTPLRLVLIADPGEDPRISAQRAAITELAAQRGIGLSELAMDGEHPLVRLAGVLQLADYASVYLGIASGIDPGQAAAITDLQARIE